MTRFAVTICAFIFTGSAVFAQTPVGIPGPTGGTICENQYALCTSATCTPDPTAPNERAVCDCVVEDGANFGVSTSCAGREPVAVSGTTKLISTYSFAQASAKEVMTCDSNEIWTDCLDMPCVVDPRDPNKAICTCNIVTGGTFVTYGGRCNTDTCTNGYWSAATPEAFAIGSAALIETLGLAGETKPYNFCEPAQ
jgi:hypothetical protein